MFKQGRLMNDKLLANERAVAQSDPSLFCFIGWDGEISHFEMSKPDSRNKFVTNVQFVFFIVFLSNSSCVLHVSFTSCAWPVLEQSPVFVSSPCKT